MASTRSTERQVLELNFSFLWTRFGEVRSTYDFIALIRADKREILREAVAFFKAPLATPR